MHAFYRHLQRHGARHTPQHLGAQAFEAIARSAHEACDSDSDQDA